MSKVVPVGYILTDEAIQEFVTRDRQWQRLNAEWEQATGEAKHKAYQAVSEVQDRITSSLIAAAKSRELPAIALKRTKSGDWIEHQLANEYLDTIGGDLALWTGSVERLGLKPSDQWISDAPFCFRRADFDRWSVKPSAEPVSRPNETAARSSKTYWTALQAVEWIATRDRLSIASATSDQRIDAVYADIVRDDVTRSLAFHRILEEENSQPPYVWRRDALELLVEACRAGQVTAYGVERGSGESGAIPLSAWVHRTIADSPHGVACRPDEFLNIELTWWNQLRFPAAQVEALWPVPASETGKEARLAPSFRSLEIPFGYPMPLTQLAGSLRPRWCHAWLLAQDCLTSPRERERILYRVAKRHPHLEPWEWLPLTERERDNRRKQIERRAWLVLKFKLEPAIIAVMGRPDWTIRGLDPSGHEVIVPTRLASQLLLNVPASSVSLADGSFVWRGITLERLAPEEPVVAQLSTAAPPDQPLPDGQILVWLSVVIARIVADGRQLRRADFEAMLRVMFGARLPPKAEERFWSLAVPEGWRKQGQGKLSAERRVDDWRVYVESPPACGTDS